MDSRDAVAKYLFMIMNKTNAPRSSSSCIGGRERSNPDEVLNTMWRYYQEQGWDMGYYRIADEVVSKGYKP